MVDEAIAKEKPIRETLSIKPHNTPLVKNIILVVDESVRADYLDINDKNNGIDTTLLNNKEALNFGWSSSATNCSLYSNLALMYGGNHDDILTFVSTKPSIWEFAKHAGYETYYINGQIISDEDNKWIDYKNIDHVITHKELGKNDEHFIDQEIAKKIKQLIKDNDKNKFLYVVKRGSHFPYEKYYPNNHAPYAPHMSEASMFAEHNSVNEGDDLVINSYKNVLSWNTAGFFKEYSSEIIINPYVLLYTADHGQKLTSNNNGSFFTHCNSASISPYEGLVPLIVLTNDDKLHKEFTRSTRINHDKTNHLNIFPTVTWLLGYNEKVITNQYDKSLTQQLEDRQQFISAPFFTKFGRKHKWITIPKRKNQ